MKPDRSNYELWIIDWLDGKLDQSKTDMLMAFLEANPDLREEAESLPLACLPAEKTIYHEKEILKKTASELTLEQVELLSVAYLENDINSEQLSDLEQNINLNHNNKKVFETIQKTRLLSPHVVYRNKNSLKKQTTGVKVFRLASIGLSAAATIAVLILSYVFLPEYFSGKNKIIVSETYSGPPFEIRTGVVLAQPEKTVGEDLNIQYPADNSAASLTYEITALAVSDTAVSNIRPSVNEITGVPVIIKPDIMPQISGFHLAATNNNFNRAIYDEERSLISRFIARNFREKILKDTITNDLPLKSYEIAEAGIEGLNKLLGWEMALVKNTDEEGELKSIYFSSRVLKFNAPVKKTEPMP